MSRPVPMPDPVKGARILLIDDDSGTRSTLGRVLRHHGAIVVEASDGQEGLALLERERYDLCVSDVCMPLLGGFGVLAALRFGHGEALAPNRDTPMFLLSGHASGEELARALDCGVEDLMAKPVDLTLFGARVRAVLRRARSVRPRAARTYGNVADFGVSGLCQALHLGARTARLDVRCDGAQALLDFHDGRLQHASYVSPALRATGRDAALAALALRNGTFEILPVPPSVPQTVFGDTQGLLLRAVAQADEAANGTDFLEEVL